MKEEILVKESNNQIIRKENEEFNYNDLVQRFINYIDVCSNTMGTYQRCLKQFGTYIKENNISIPTREDILNYKEYLMSKEHPNTVNLYLTSLKSFYKWLEYENITKDITRNIKLIRLDKTHLRRALTPEEVQRILNVCKDTREKLLITLSLTCALRSNEVVNIRLEDFYVENGEVMLKILGKGRTSKVDSVKIDSRVFDLIKQYVREYKITDYLFTSTSKHNTNGKLNTITIRRIFNNLCEKANIDRNKCSYHSCRHFSATQAIKNGMDLLEVSEMLRHKSVSVTQVYVDEIKKSESKFANVLGDVVFND